MTMTDRLANDIGGNSGNCVDRHEHAVTLFEKRVDAMFALLTSPDIKAFTVDALRRSVERNTPEDYLTLGYYEKWIFAIRNLLLEQKVITQEELDAAIRAAERAEPSE